MNATKTQIIVRIGLAIIVILFTLFGFIINPGSTDNFVIENLWEALHPLKIQDIIGLILFYGGALFLSGLIKWEFDNPANSSKWNYFLFGILALGIVLIWV